VKTSADGQVIVMAQGFGDNTIDAQVVTLTPLQDATTAATFAGNAGSALFGWRCGSSADGTTIASKFLPATCRG
jgi:type IV pilus assembly protein PilA